MTRQTAPLAGRTIAVPESRQLDIFANMLEVRGAQVMRCPLVTILDAPDPAPIQGWLEDFSNNGCDDLILLTGEGLRRLLGVAERTSDTLHRNFVSRLSDVRTICRGPKPAKALREIGLRSSLAAAAPTTDGVIETLSSQSLEGRRIGVQLYGTDPNHKLIDFLNSARAEIKAVAPYIYADESEDTQVTALISKLDEGEIDAIAFTSSPQVRRLFSVAKSQKLEANLTKALNSTTVAAVGPIVAQALEKRGIEVDLIPESSFFMKPLVRKLVAKFSG